MMDRSGESTYEYDGLGRITKVTTGSGETTTYEYGVNDRLSKLTYADGESVSYEYDKNDNLTKVTDRTGAETTYVYDAINRVTEIHRPNGVSTYNTYNARDQIVSMKNICDDCGWVISQYDYTYDDRGFIVGEDAVESLYGYAWDDKHDGKHENWHDDNYPHGDKHTNKHDKDGEYNFQIIETKRSFTYDADGKLLTVSEDEDRQGHYDYEMTYDDMGNRTSYTKSRNGEVVESGEYTYNLSNQLVSAKLYDGKKHTTMEYTYDADGNLIAEDGTIGTDKVEKDYIYTVENRLKAVYDGDDLLVAMAYDGDGNRIFQLNYNLHTDDDWKGNSGNGNGNNKDNKGNGSGKSLWSMIVDFFTGGDEEETDPAMETESTTEPTSQAESTGFTDPTATLSTFKRNDNGNNGNNGNGGNGNHYGWESGEGEDGEDPDDDSTGEDGTDGKDHGSGNTNNTGGSENQSGILFPEEGEVSELEEELIGMIKTEGHEKNYELIEYVNDVNRENAEVLMELNINGKMDTAYSYGNERLTVERFDGWTGYYTYDPRGSVSGVTGSDGYLWQSYRYDPFGDISFGKPQYNNVYAYNAESFNPNLDTIYLRARYYYTSTANFLSEDTYLGDISDPLTLNRYNYGKSSYLNYKDPSGHFVLTISSVLAVAAIGAVTGLVVEVISQATSGEDWDAGAIVKSTLIGATGATVGAVTGTLVGSGLAALGITAGTTFSQSFAIGATTAAVSGIATRVNNNTLNYALNYDKIHKDDYLIDLEPNPRRLYTMDLYDYIIEPSLDIEAVTMDALMGGIAGGISFEVNEALNKRKTSSCSVSENAKIKGNSEAQVSKNSLKHINNRHNPNSYAKQMQYKPEVDVKAELKYTSFFNKDWSKSQIEDAVNVGFKQATNKGVTSGSYSFSYKGEKVTMYLENGAVKTAYGDYKYTYEELLELVK